MPDLDSRLHAFRPDLADAKLQGRVDANKFVEGVVMEVVVPVATLHREASVDRHANHPGPSRRKACGIRDCR